MKNKIDKAVEKFQEKVNKTLEDSYRSHVNALLKADPKIAKKDLSKALKKSLGNCFDDLMKDLELPVRIDASLSRVATRNKNHLKIRREKNGTIRKLAQAAVYLNDQVEEFHKLIDRSVDQIHNMALNPDHKNSNRLKSFNEGFVKGIKSLLAAAAAFASTFAIGGAVIGGLGTASVGGAVIGAAFASHALLTNSAAMTISPVVTAVASAAGICFGGMTVRKLNSQGVKGIEKLSEKMAFEASLIASVQKSREQSERVRS